MVVVAELVDLRRGMRHVYMMASMPAAAAP